MLTEKLKAFVADRLEEGENIEAAMAGFRPLTRSAALLAIFPMVLAGFAVSAAAGWPAWVGGGLGGGTGAGLAMWLDQRRARTEHDGQSLSLGLVVTDRRLFILDLETGMVAADVAGIHREESRHDLSEVTTEKMQGSGFKRMGAVLHFRDGSVERVIPARTEQFLKALAG